MDFDPYETWLSIPADRRPPTHYDLLGLAPHESNPVVIDQAALRRMSKVRQHQIGPHSDQSQEILSELARARLILMDPDRRADYDAKLLARGEDIPVRPGASEKHGNGAAALGGPDQSAPDVFASLALSLRAGDRPSSLDGGRSERPSGWKKAAIGGSILATHAALLGAFLLYFFGPPNLKQKVQELLRVDPDRLAQQPKPSVLPAPKPNFPPRPAPPPIVAPPRAAPPREEGKPEPRAVVTQGDKDEGPVGPGQASDKSDPNKDKPDLAAVGSPEQRLKDLGLQRVGSVYVLQGERDLLKKFGEVQTSYLAYSSAFDRKTEIEFRLARARELDQAIIDLDLAIHAHYLELEKRPGRPNNNIEQAYFDGVKNELDAIRVQRINADNEVRRIRSQPTPPGVIQELDAELRSCRQRCDSMLGEARELINSTDASYESLLKNPNVEAALNELEGKSKKKLKLGHAPEYWQIVKRVEQLEKSLNPSDPMSPSGERDKAGKSDKPSYRRDRKKG